MVDKKLLIIGFVWPEPKGSAAGSRMMQLIDLFRTLEYHITFCSSSNVNEHSQNLDQFEVSTQQIALNSSSFDSFITELDPAIVLFDRFMTEEQYGWRVAENCPNALRILDSEDLHFLRKGREEALKKGDVFNDSYIFSAVAKREIASIYRCDLTLIISEFEMDLLLSLFKIDEALIYYLPFLLDESHIQAKKNLPSFENRKDFISIGNFLHPPNIDAVLQLKHQLWPSIRRQLPTAKLTIYGAYPPQKALQLNNNKEGFLVKGFVDDADSVMRQSRICLAPLRFGAGLKGKLITAMCNGTPVVMSTIASEGMFGTMAPNGFVSDDPQDFVNEAIRLYSDEILWKEKQDNGFKVINERFQKSGFYNSFQSKVEAIQSNLELHRQSNFMGQILMHHTMQSTKYMSKWIEEKNSNHTAHDKS